VVEEVLLEEEEEDRGGEVRCYACRKTGHMSWECPEKNKEGGGEAHISEAQKRNVEAEGA
jgi:hypothetical protein